MRATSIGHAGMLIETDAGSIVCDPWFVPAFFVFVMGLQERFQGWRAQRTASVPQLGEEK